MVAGSVHRSAAGTDFSVSGGGETVPVENAGSPPQLFQPTIPVVVVGHFASAASDTFRSDQIMVKHSATYVAAHPGRVRGRDGAVAGPDEPGAATRVRGRPPSPARRRARTGPGRPRRPPAGRRC